MTNLIVAFPKPEDAKSIRNMLVKHGYPVAGVCISGARALQYADDLHSGIVICGYRLADMMYSQLREDLPPQFDVLVLVGGRYREEITEKNVQVVTMPLKVYELLSAVENMVEANERRRRRQRAVPKERSQADQQLIRQAKALLMEKKQMTEEEAHRYVQKQSMDNGVSMLENAQVILSLFQHAAEG